MFDILSPVAGSTISEEQNTLAEIYRLAGILLRPPASLQEKVEATSGFRRVLSSPRPPVDSIVNFPGLLREMIKNLVPGPTDPNGVTLVSESLLAIGRIAIYRADAVA